MPVCQGAFFVVCSPLMPQTMLHHMMEIWRHVIWWHSNAIMQHAYPLSDWTSHHVTFYELHLHYVSLWRASPHFYMWLHSIKSVISENDASQKQI